MSREAGADRGGQPLDFGGKPYRSLDYECKRIFGQKLYKISLNGGMTCPNRDGTLDTRGCIFCSAGGSGDFAPPPGLSIAEQIEAGKQVFRDRNLGGRPVKGKYAGQKFIAYFQSYTNTYASVPYLESVFWPAIRHPDIVCLSVGTRPDCLPPGVLALLEELQAEKPVWVELGLQTVHERTARLIRRGYALPVFEQALCKLQARGIPVIVHVILGLPGETREDMLETVRYLSDRRIDGIKLQLMHVLKGTDLEKLDFPLMTLDEYVDVLIACIENLDPSVAVHRITGDGPKGLLVAPDWSADKKKVLNRIHHEMKVRGTWQGKALAGGAPAGNTCRLREEENDDRSTYIV